MKKFLLALVAASLLGPAASAQVHVKGYTKKDGTYVAPYYRSSPNNTKLDNYSTKGNVNPYTGKVGTKDPYGSSNSNGSYGSYSNPYSSSSDKNGNPPTTCYYPPC
jgi:hypothetical protein